MPATRTAKRLACNPNGVMITDHKRAYRLAKTDSEVRIGEAQLEASRALTANCCPRCGHPVRQNLAISGWVQCAQYGAPSFRARPADPACEWQGFCR